MRRQVQLFLHSRPIVVLRRRCRPEKYWGCIFCIRIMLADAAILQMQAMQSLEIAEGCILVKSL